MNILIPKDDNVKELLLDFRDACDYALKDNEIKDYVLIMPKNELFEDKSTHSSFENLKNALIGVYGKSAIYNFAKRELISTKVLNKFKFSFSNGLRKMGWSGIGEISILSPLWDNKTVQSIKVKCIGNNLFWGKGYVCTMDNLENIFEGKKVAFGNGLKNESIFQKFPSKRERTQ